MHKPRPGRRNTRGAELQPFLERLVEHYHRPEFLGSDPLTVVHRFESPADREIAALWAALLAYGNVKQILRSLDALFHAMNNAPASFVLNFDHESAANALGEWKHRFTDTEDVLCLSWLLHQALRANDFRLEQVFSLGYRTDEPDLVHAASRFLDYLCSMSFEPFFSRERMLGKSSFKHLLPRADRGSACKRIHLWLRWMIRPADGVDLGLWTSIPPGKLLMPVDTHILRIGKNLGLITTSAGDLRAAREITERLRSAAPYDPVRYDFSLCRLGILQKCPTASNLANCKTCELHDPCRRRAKLEKRVGRSL